MEKFDILCLGELAIDYISNTDLITDNPSSVILKSLEKFYGGMGGNFSVAASLFRSDVTVVGYLENDSEGRDYKSYLSSKGVDLSNVLESKWASHARCFIFNQKEKTRIFFYSGALAEEPRRYIRHASALVNKIASSAVYCGSMNQELNNFYLAESRAGIKAFAPAHNTYLISKADFKDCLERTDVLFLNSHESEIIERMFGMGPSQIAKKFNVGVLIKTLGKKGSQIIVDGRTNIIPPCKASRELDHNGAGDAFAGGFLANYVKTRDPIYSAKMASSIASFVVEEVGCQTGIPVVEKVIDRARRTYGASAESRQKANRKPSFI
ncbi:MAG TPA: PfkB family carbohydrate kinase [Candidatus Saccharimonadales bacterium]|nr:PfkB family carbohydrate kinase [Candidatus Saccharimonadales bacterium]